MNKTYPRVLIISRTLISERNSSGASRGSWFRDWPKDNLAQLYSSAGPEDPPYCGSNYLLTGREHRRGRLFNLLKRNALSELSGSAKPASPTAVPPRGLAKHIISSLVRLGKKCLIETGLWELLFQPKFSRELKEWIETYRPEVIYAAVTDLWYTRLTLMISRQYSLPICLHIDDDWPGTRYRKSVLGAFMYPKVDRAFRRLIKEAALCLSIGPLMTKAYLERYGVRFLPFMMAEEPSRFQTAVPRRLAPTDEVSIVYSGSILLNRWQSLLDLCEAVKAVREEGTPVSINIFAPIMPDDVRDKLVSFPFVKIHPPPKNAEVPAIFTGADILFLPEGFAERYREYIKYSISSKSHLYMMSGRPILVYGPAGVGVVEYAREFGWGYVVDQQDKTALGKALRLLISDKQSVRKLVEKSYSIAEAHHNAETIRERLRLMMMDISDAHSIII